MNFKYMLLVIITFLAGNSIHAMQKNTNIELLISNTSQNLARLDIKKGPNLPETHELLVPEDKKKINLAGLAVGTPVELPTEKGFYEIQFEPLGNEVFLTKNIANFRAEAKSLIKSGWETKMSLIKQLSAKDKKNFAAIIKPDGTVVLDYIQP